MKTRLVVIVTAATLAAVGAIACEGRDRGTPAEAPAAQRREDTSVYGRYLAIQAALAADSLAGVADAASAIARGVRADTTGTMLPAVAEQAEAVAQAADLAAAREAFKLLSESLIESLASLPEKDRYYVVDCPMAKGRWLQDSKTIANPYYGKSMLRCGEISETSKE